MRKSEGYYQEGIADFNVDQQRAFVSFQKAIELNPDHRDAHYAVGHVYALQGQYEKAEAEVREVLRIDPEFPEAHNHLGEVLSEQGRWGEAIRSYRRALTYPLYETPDVAWYNLGEALAYQGEMEAAKEAFERALRVSPLSVPQGRLYYRLGRTYYRLGDDAKAREALTRSTKLDPGGRAGSKAEKLLERLKP
ncbi:tetratricopeptide repeat protein [Nitrospiraceae bacterium AH_259_D15_M11_P09]|nr:tetratricopeptide repeat protein [Nitrospiraceae bacterium AH_259_D15_M11_P09]